MRLSFIIIDDRELDCYIAEKFIHKTGLSNRIRIFSNAILGLDFIKNTTVESTPAIILLDIMMPVMSGFEFMDEFEKLPLEIKSNYRIIAITTSLNKNEISKIATYESVIDVLRKPYTFEALVNAIQPISERSGQ